MKCAENRFSLAGIEKLAALIGQTFVAVSGRGMVKLQGSAQDPALLNDLVILDTNESNLCGWVKTVYLDFLGFDEEYSIFDFSSATQGEIAKAECQGKKYFFQTNQGINEVYVVTEKLSCAEAGVEVWEYLTDIAVVLQLSNSSVVIQKDNHNDEELVVKYPGEFELEQLRFVEGRFEEDIHSVITRTQTAQRAAEFLSETN